MKVALVWPKMEVANCSQRRMERPDESRPPRYRYSLRLAMMAAPEKHPKAIAVPTNAVTRILVDDQSRSRLTKQRRIARSISSRDHHSCNTVNLGSYFRLRGNGSGWGIDY